MPKLWPQPEPVMVNTVELSPPLPLPLPPEAAA